MISQEYLDSLLLERDEIAEYALESLEYLSCTLNSSKTIKYLSACDLPGIVCPSLIKYKRDKKLRKGRLISTLPQNNHYVSLHYNHKGEIIAIKKYNQYGCDQTMYFFQKNGSYYGVPFISDTKQIYGSKIIKWTFIGDQIIEYAEIEKTFVICEQYSYANISEGIIDCDWSHYVNSAYADYSSTVMNLLESSITKLRVSQREMERIEKVSRTDFFYIIHTKKGKISDIEEYRNERNIRELIRHL